MSDHWRRCAFRLATTIVSLALAGLPPMAGASPDSQRGVSMTQSDAVERLAGMNGRAYLEERDRVLQNAPRQAPLTAPADGDWRLRLQARILQGWIDEGALYRQILTELDAVDFERERRTAIGIARVWDMYALRTSQQYHERVLPLAWEAIEKFDGDWPAWKVVTFLYMIGAAPVEESIEPVVALLERTADPLLRSASAQTLAKLPRQAVERRLASAEARHHDVLRAIAEARDRFE
jgi:hypothetical protein